MTRTVFVILLLSCMVASAAKLDTRQIHSLVLNHAYVEKVEGRLIEDASTVTGLANVDMKIRVLQENTWVIPNRIGTGFVLDVGFDGIPKDVTHFDLQVKYPQMILPDGQTRSSIHRPIDLSGHEGVYIWSFGFYFDFPYETAPGEWELQVFSKGSLIHRSTFQIVESSD